MFDWEMEDPDPVWEADRDLCLGCVQVDRKLRSMVEGKGSMDGMKVRMFRRG